MPSDFDYTNPDDKDALDISPDTGPVGAKEANVKHLHDYITFFSGVLLLGFGIALSALFTPWCLFISLSGIIAGAIGVIRYNLKERKAYDVESRMPIGMSHHAAPVKINKEMEPKLENNKKPQEKKPPNNMPPLNNANKKEDKKPENKNPMDFSKLFAGMSGDKNKNNKPASLNENKKQDQKNPMMPA